MNVAQPFINRPVMTTLVMSAILLFGIVAHRFLPVSDLPSVDYPTIQISANLPGASPETMAAAVATPLEKQFSTIAKSSPHDTVRAAALGRVHDAKALGSVARHAADPQTALDAVARLSDSAELLNVALKTEHKDAGVSALDKAVDPSSPDARETLGGIANRAKSKAVGKRARAILQAMDEAEAARRAALENWQQSLAGEAPIGLGEAEEAGQVATPGLAEANAHRLAQRRLDGPPIAGVGGVQKRLGLSGDRVEAQPLEFVAQRPVAGPAELPRGRLRPLWWRWPFRLNGSSTSAEGCRRSRRCCR